MALSIGEDFDNSDSRVSSIHSGGEPSVVRLRLAGGLCTSNKRSADFSAAGSLGRLDNFSAHPRSAQSLRCGGFNLPVW